jgi:hypothetical protein
MQKFMTADMQRCFSELLPAFLQYTRDGISHQRVTRGPYSAVGLGTLKWFCSCAGPERMGSAETAHAVLTRNRSGDPCKLAAVLAAAGKELATLCGSTASKLLEPVNQLFPIHSIGFIGSNVCFQTTVAACIQGSQPGAWQEGQTPGQASAPMCCKFCKTSCTDRVLDC